ncbi:MAG: rRNA methyltransferase [Desulfurococcales archaeon]|nr:rRNA methyltransferase [Desulfurococcales archaeon]
MDRIRVVLVGVEGAINLGIVARLSVNFNVDEFYIVNPKASLSEALEYAARAKNVLKEAIVVDRLENALEGVSLSICTSAISREESVLRIAVPPWEAARIGSMTRGTVALVFGRESVGLTRSELEQCDLLSTIPANPTYPTLNLSTAVSIYLYEFYRRRNAGQDQYIDTSAVKLYEAYVSALARALILDEKRRRDVIIAARRIALKGYTSRKEIENLTYLLSRACRRIEGCKVEVAIDNKSGP